MYLLSAAPIQSIHTIPDSVITQTKDVVNQQDGSTISINLCREVGADLQPEHDQFPSFTKDDV